jgi:hypothetical protein
MWPVTIFLMIVVGFYWLAACATVWFWMNALFSLCRLHFVRASIWLSLGSAMFIWWDGRHSMDEFMSVYAVFIGIGVLATFVRWRKKQQAMQAIPTMPTWTPPKTPANDNQPPMFSLHAKSEG